MSHIYHSMPLNDFAHFGVPIIAYVKPINVEGERIFALYSADGKHLDTSKTEREATMAAHARNLLPVIVH